MDTEIRINAEQAVPKAVIFTAEITDEVKEAVRKLSEKSPRIITGIKDGITQILEPEQLYRIYSGGGKVMAVTDEGEFILKSRLYEMEEMLDGMKFVRISNSELINLKKVKGFDLSLTGTICVKMKDKSVTYVSRRYVTKIKKILGI